MLLAFTGAWCAPSVRDLPYLEAAYEQSGPRGLDILAVDITWGHDWLSDTYWLVKHNAIPWQIVYDARGILAAVYGIDAVPDYALVDASSGRVLAHWHGAQGESLLPELEEELLALGR